MKDEVVVFMDCWREWYKMQEDEQKDHLERFTLYTPTLTPYGDFDVEADAEALRAAMKGFGTSEDEIVEILCRRSSDQRLQIQDKYQQLHGRDLLDDLKGELGGSLGQVILSLMKPVTLLLAEAIRDATEGAGTDEDALIQIFCTRDDKAIDSIKSTFEDQFEKQLEEVLCKETSGDFEQVLMSILATCRSDDADPAEIADNLASEDTDEDSIRLVLTGHSFPFLLQICDEYEQKTGETFDALIEAKCRSDVQKSFKAIYHSAKDRPQFFAERLHSAMEGCGTDDSDLIRILVSRCEIDLGTVMEKYQQTYDKALPDQIKEEASGDYAQALLTLLGTC